MDTYSDEGSLFENISDVATGSLGIFMLLTVVLLLAQTTAKNRNDLFERKIEEQKGLIRQKRQTVERNIQELQFRAEAAASRAEQTKKKIEALKTRVEQYGPQLAELDEASSLLAKTEEAGNAAKSLSREIKTLRNEKSGLLWNRRSMPIRNSINTDQSGRPFVTYGVRGESFVMGDRRLSRKQMTGFVLSISGDQIFLKYNSEQSDSPSVPDWVWNFFAELGWHPASIPVKSGYQ